MPRWLIGGGLEYIGTSDLNTTQVRTSHSPSRTTQNIKTMKSLPIQKEWYPREEKRRQLHVQSSAYVSVEQCRDGEHLASHLQVYHFHHASS